MRTACSPSSLDGTGRSSTWVTASSWGDRNHLEQLPGHPRGGLLLRPGQDRIHCVYTGTQDSKAIAKQARASLPRYMVPNLYHQVETMPHNPNGKIDRPRLREEYLGHETH